MYRSIPSKRCLRAHREISTSSDKLHVAGKEQIWFADSDTSRTAHSTPPLTAPSPPLQGLHSSRTTCSGQCSCTESERRGAVQPHESCCTRTCTTAARGTAVPGDSICISSRWSVGPALLPPDAYLSGSGRGPDREPPWQWSRWHGSPLRSARAIAAEGAVARARVGSVRLHNSTNSAVHGCAFW